MARYADACNLGPGPELPHKLEVLRRHCEAEGRDYGAIEKTVEFRFDVGERGERVEQELHRLADLGIETAIGSVRDVWRLDPLRIMGERIIPVVAGLHPANA